MSTLYISDLDGTLLDHRGQLSTRSREGLQALLDGGLAFTVASARSHFSIRQLFGDRQLRLPIIEFNGAFITDFATGEHLEINALGQGLAEELFDHVLAAGQRPFVCSFDGTEDCLHYDELINPGMVWYEQRRREAGDPRLRLTRDLRRTMSEDVVSLTVMDQDELQIRRLKERLEHLYGEALQLYCYENEYSKGTFWLTIHHARASKHIAMQSLRDRHAPGCELVAIGDNFNDVMMLTHADRAIAVANAVDELQRLAHRVIDHHAEDSVVRFLEQDFSRRAENATVIC